ncbi:MAG: hypothetical protein IJT58_06520 [Synergistaceae bacterium]|nr:hypothetical protein [Synergistaceae bacterium]
MKKFMCLLTALLFLTLLSTTTKSEAKTSWQEVYKRTARAFVEKHVFPDGEKVDEEEVFEDFSDNQIALCDVNNDGQPELLIVFQSGSMASKLEYVCGFNEKSGKLIIEHIGFPAIEFFDNGCLREFASHNQGLAGEFWPYSLAKYNPKSGKYEYIGSVDAWSKEYSPKNPFENNKAFPDKIDKTGDGFVYYIDDSDFSKAKGPESPVDTPVYHEWEKKYIGGAKVIEPNWLPANKKGLNALNKAISQE